MSMRLRTIVVLGALCAMQLMVRFDAPPTFAATRDPRLIDTRRPESLTLDRDRNRLLEEFGKRHRLSACELWTRMSESEQGVFLTITDLLGNRSPMENRASLTSEQALAYVKSIVAIRGQSPYGTCGGKRWSRMYVVVSDRLLDYLRHPKRGLPTWRASRDGWLFSVKFFWWVGPHAPFNGSAETEHGRPRGQAHFWSGSPSARRSIHGIGQVHPNTVEFDEDYNAMHDSGPDCVYGSDLGPVSGRAKHHLTWASLGNGHDPSWDFVPYCLRATGTLVANNQ